MIDNQKLVKELATRINRIVNIPLVNEENEQAFFEMVVSILLGIFFAEIDNRMS
jgi:hypothetical protein